MKVRCEGSRSTKLQSLWMVGRGSKLRKFMVPENIATWQMKSSRKLLLYKEGESVQSTLQIIFLKNASQYAQFEASPKVIPLGRKN